MLKMLPQSLIQFKLGPNAENSRKNDQKFGHEKMKALKKRFARSDPGPGGRGVIKVFERSKYRGHEFKSMPDYMMQVERAIVKG